MIGGSERIRTSGTVARSHAFQACSLNSLGHTSICVIIAYFAEDGRVRGNSIFYENV